MVPDVILNVATKMIETTPKMVCISNTAHTRDNNSLTYVTMGLTERWWRKSTARKSKPTLCSTTAV